MLSGSLSSGGRILGGEGIIDRLVLAEKAFGIVSRKTCSLVCIFKDQIILFQSAPDFRILSCSVHKTVETFCESQKLVDIACRCIEAYKTEGLHENFEFI